MKFKAFRLIWISWNANYETEQLEYSQTIYYSVFLTHIWDVCQVWGQGKSWLLTQIGKSQNKALAYVLGNYYELYKCH